MSYSYDPTKVYLTSAIPVFTLQSTSNSIVVTLSKSDGSVVFSTTLYTYNTYAYVRDIRSVIEQDLKDSSRPSGYYYLKVIENGGDPVTVAAFTAIHCALIYSGNMESLLQTHFFTTATSKQITRLPDTLHCFIRKTETPSHSCYVVYRNASGVVRSQQYNYAISPVSSDNGEVRSFTVNPSTYASLGTILAITTSIGQRSFTHYYTDMPSSFSAYYANPFNVLELCQCCGVTKRKVETERSEAVMQHVTSFYDQSSLESREVESAPLPHFLAAQLAELSFSHEVHLVDGDFTDPYRLPLILITDSSVEVSDEQAEMSTVKITYRYADNSPHMKI